MACAPGGPIQRRHGVRERLGPILQQALGQGGKGGPEAYPSLVEVRRIHRQVGAEGTGHAAHACHRQVGGCLGSHAIGQLVGFVDDDGVIVSEELALRARVDAEEGVVGDDHIRLGGLRARRLSEALINERAVLAQALGLGHRRVVPRAVGHAGRQIVAIPAPRLADPLADAHNLAAELSRRPRLQVSVLEERPLGRIPSVELVHARVVLPAFEDRDLQPHARHRRDRVDRHGRILDENLALQRKGRRRHDAPDPARRAVRQQRHEVSERLAGPGAGLDKQVRAILQGGRPFGDHRCLSLAGDPAHRGDGGIEDSPRRLNQVVAHAPVTAVPATVPRTASRATTAASAASTRATIRVPASTYSSRSTSPSSWIRCTREPAE